MNLVLLGMPGSGKGTQAQKIVDKFGLYYLQTGSLAREWALFDPRIREIVDSGKLIPDEEMTNYIVDHIEKEVPGGDNILFEGFPRYINQYEFLSNWLSKRGKKIDSVIVLKVDEEDVIIRLSSRRICEKCSKSYNLVTNPPVSEICDNCGGKLVQREDDNPESIKIRFKAFYENTNKLIEYLGDKVLWIDGSQSIDEVFNEIIGKLKLEGIE